MKKIEFYQIHILSTFFQILNECHKIFWFSCLFRKNN